MDYHLTVNGLVRFRDRIYVLDNNELKKLILREFHAKLYSVIRISKYIDNSEEVLLLVESEEGRCRFCG